MDIEKGVMKHDVYKIDRGSKFCLKFLMKSLEITIIIQHINFQWNKCNVNKHIQVSKVLVFFLMGLEMY